MKNLAKILLILFIVFSFAIYINPTLLRNIVLKVTPDELRAKIKDFVLGEDFLDKYFYEINYNEKKLPELQFQSVKVNSLDVGDIVGKSVKSHFGGNYKTAFIESFNDDGLIIISNSGKIQILDDLNKKKVIEMKTNIPENIRVVGSEKKDDKNIFLSIYENNKDISECDFLTILKGNIDNTDKTINFTSIFNSEECISGGLGGELALAKNNKLFFTTSASAKFKDLAQDDNSVFGKVIEINLEDNSFRIFSKGHRNPQGLMVTKDNYLIATEHGPYGGDEVNNIIYGKNYGWPISSYGEPYSFKKEKGKFSLKKNHVFQNFEEPIFAFIPSIGISKIIEIPDGFSDKMTNNFFITSLNRKSIYRTKFDKNFEKIIFMEEIRLDGRVRDAVFIKNLNSFVFYLEDISKLVIIKSS